MSFFKLIDIEE